MFAKQWIVAVCVALGVAAHAWALGDMSVVLDILRKNGKPPDVWLPRTAIAADFTCDGKPDILIRGIRGPNGIVALLPSTNDMPFVKPDIFEVYVSDLKSVRIVKEEHFCDADGEPLVGCKPARGCWDFRVERDSIDSLHCYWDQRHRRSACWTR